MKTYRILNLGAGVQSTTVALMGLKNWEYWHCSEPLPYPAVGLLDFAIFADTQEEPKAEALCLRAADALEFIDASRVRVLHVSELIAELREAGK